MSYKKAGVDQQRKLDALLSLNLSEAAQAKRRHGSNQGNSFLPGMDGQNVV